MNPGMLPVGTTLLLSFFGAAVLLFSGIALICTWVEEFPTFSLFCAVALLAGIGVDLCIVVASESSALGAVSALALAGFGVYRLVGHRQRRSHCRQAIAREAVPLLIVLLVFTAVAVRAATLRVLGWDFSQHWAFHGVVFAIEKTFGGTLASPEAIRCLHPDYPPLLGVLLSQLGLIAGAGLSIGRAVLPIMALPCLFGFAALSPRNVAGGSAWFVVFFAQSSMVLWSGFLDFHLTLAGLCAVTFLLIWRETGEVLFFACCLAFAVYGLALKNDGIFLCLAIAGGVVCLFGRKERMSLMRAVREPQGVVAAAVLALGVVMASLLLWSLVKQRYGLVGDLVLNGDYIHRVCDRIASFDPKTVMPLLLPRQTETLAAAFCVWIVLLVAAGCDGIRASRGSIASIFVMVTVYAALLAFVYLGTPHSMLWQICTSIQRTTLLPQHLLLLAALFAVAPPEPLRPRAIEKKRGAASGSTPSE